MWLTVASALAGGSYTLSFPERQAQRIAVEASLDATGPSTELFMATWTPGSYLVREYARHIEGLEAVDQDGRALPVRKTTKNRWQVDTDGVRRFTLRYRLHASALSVRGNYVDADVAVLNGAPTFIVPADLLGPYEIRVERPDGWNQTLTQLPSDNGKLVASSFDLLVDSPIVVGNPRTSRFEVDGVPHVLVDFPPSPEWDSDKAAGAVKKIAEVQHAFWGEIPYERYLYLNWIADAGGGGLEHLSSTLMMTQRDNTADEKRFEGWLGLVAHEQFHAWNVKRLRPEALGPFDYENEVYTPDLWIAEGFTSYYDDLLLLRAGLIDEQDWIGRMDKSLRRIVSTPGRLEQSVSEASHDAWIKHYRPDANSVNTSISYYTKGAVIAWLLDARIRQETRGRASLDDVMREAYHRYSGDRGYTTEQFRDLISEIAGVELGPQLTQWADTATELDLTQALDWFGLELRPPEEDEREAWLGASIGNGTVKHVLRDGPAWKAGLQEGDELLALDTHRVKDLQRVLERFEPGDQVELLISRRGQVRSLSAKLGPSPLVLELKIAENDRKGAKHREAWATQK